MPEISTINITGPDAAEFLQGQLTNDINRLDGESEILAAWCNPKGRVICCGPLRRIADGFGYAVPAEIADDVMRRLTMFRFRSKVDLDVDSHSETADPGELIESGLPFIFMNAAGTQRDVVTLCHEGGHAMHTFLTNNEPLIHYRDTQSVSSTPYPSDGSIRTFSKPSPVFRPATTNSSGAVSPCWSHSNSTRC